MKCSSILCPVQGLDFHSFLPLLPLVSVFITPVDNLVKVETVVLNRNITKHHRGKEKEGGGHCSEQHEGAFSSGLAPTRSSRAAKLF